MRNNWPGLIHGGEVTGLAASGETPAEITPELGKCLGYAFALWLAKRQDTTSDKLTVAVGRDARNTGPALMQAVIHGLTAADCDVYDAGETTSAAVYLAIAESGADGAIMVTAGGLGDDANGFKLMTEAGMLDVDEKRALLRQAQTVTVPHRLVTNLDVMDPYRQRLFRMARRRLEDDVQCPMVGLYVAVTEKGAGGFLAETLAELGAEIVSVPLKDGRAFRFDDAEDIETLTKAVLENEADLGIGLEMDGTRAFLVDRDGRPLTRNRLIALMAAILLEEHPGATIVTDSVTSSGAARFITEWGGTHYRYKRGHQLVIREAMRLNEEDIDCPVAIETSGHAALRENDFLDDGVYLSAFVLCEALNLKRDGKTLAELIQELAEPVESAEIRMPVIAEDYRAAAQSAIETVLSHTLDNPEWRLARDNREGVRINFDLDGDVDNAWLLLRLSVHEAVMPLNVESDVPGGVKRILSALYELLQDFDEIDLDPLRAAMQ